MKVVSLEEVSEYSNSDKWLSEEVTGKLLISSMTFTANNKKYIKVSIFVQLSITIILTFIITDIGG